ncbi:hypothetical protein [Prosthecobacter sp.]|uniref:hypothetical protein n=1 Tax=Prosthecobacter sp. TaxID=1965333 RepID=UPI003784066A
MKALTLLLSALALAAPIAISMDSRFAAQTNVLIAVSVGAAILVELTGIIRCATTVVPFGRAFRYAIAAQFVAPFIMLGVFTAWDWISPATHGLEPLTGNIWDRFDLFGGSLFWAVLATLFMASLAAVSTFFHSSESNNANTRNA